MLVFQTALLLFIVKKTMAKTRIALRDILQQIRTAKISFDNGDLANLDTALIKAENLLICFMIQNFSKEGQPPSPKKKD